MKTLIYLKGHFTAGYRISKEKMEKQKCYGGLKFQMFVCKVCYFPFFREMANFRSYFIIRLLFNNCFPKK